jgi:amino acid transporter
MRWASASLLFVVVMALCFVLFVVFNWILYNPDSGVNTILDEFAQEGFNRYYRHWWNNLHNNISAGFAIAGIVCMFLAIICYIADVFSKPEYVQ